MPRLRLGVALLVPDPVAGEIEVLWRACGEQAPERIAPHLTLVPPVNVRHDRLDEALTRLRSAAGASRPLKLTLGPPATFLPDNPVLFLAVGGQVDALGRLRDAVFHEPLARPLTWPFHPHVTVVDGGAPSRLLAAVEALGDYRAMVTIDRVDLLHEQRDDHGVRVWRSIADAALARRRVVGRGGLDLEVVIGTQLDPVASTFRKREWAAIGPAHPRVAHQGLSVSARRDAAVVGTAVGWSAGDIAQLSEVIVAGPQRGEGVGAHLVAAFLAEASARGCRLVRARVEGDDQARGFLARLGWTEEPALPGGSTIELHRDLLAQ